MTINHRQALRFTSMYRTVGLYGLWTINLRRFRSAVEICGLNSTANICRSAADSQSRSRFNLQCVCEPPFDLLCSVGVEPNVAQSETKSWQYFSHSVTPHPIVRLSSYTRCWHFSWRFYRSYSFASAVYTTANPSVCLSVRPSITLRYYVKTRERRGMRSSGKISVQRGLLPNSRAVHILPHNSGT